MTAVDIKTYTKERISDVIEFEKELRRQEDVWGWEIDGEYISKVTASFDDDSFRDSVSLLGYADGKVVGRIDCSMIKSRFDGSTKAYLDWICVLKSHRHRGVGQALLAALRSELKERNIDTMIALTAANDEAQSFYKAVPDSVMRDTGIWIDIK
ncbi:MAG: GNAT family N-acetyltransferase [Clostridia bacterium]|nr:GNAT family N-acetyltransferase [Clostridia bacterium]